MSMLYSNFKIFHFHSKLRDLLKGVISAPIHIRLKPTNRCNHSCYYCCYRNSNLYIGEVMNEIDEIPLDKMREIVSDLARIGVKAVTFSGGGDPLLYSYLNETIESLLDTGIKVAVLTNGSLLEGKNAKILAKRATWVRISMDAADAQTYSKIRKVSLVEFDKVCNNIRNFAKIKRKSCELGINFIVTKENHRDVFKFLKLMKRLGVGHVKVCESVVSTKKEENIKRYAPFFDSVKKQVAEGMSVLAEDNFTIIDKFSDFASNYKKQYTSCPVIQCLTVIAADMNVYACQDKAYTKKGMIGSIKDTSFQKMWFSDKTKSKLLSLNPGKECNHHCTKERMNLVLRDYFGVNKGHLEFV